MFLKKKYKKAVYLRPAKERPRSHFLSIILDKFSKREFKRDIYLRRSCNYNRPLNDFCSVLFIESVISVFLYFIVTQLKEDVTSIEGLNKITKELGDDALGVVAKTSFLYFMISIILWFICYRFLIFRKHFFHKLSIALYEVILSIPRLTSGTLFAVGYFQLKIDSCTAGLINLITGIIFVIISAGFVVFKERYIRINKF